MEETIDMGNPGGMLWDFFTSTYKFSLIVTQSVITVFYTDFIANEFYKQL